jgi:hypothetical protein
VVVAGCLGCWRCPPPDPDTDAAVALIRYVLGGQVIDDAAD